MAEAFSNKLARAVGVVTSSTGGSIGITTNLITGISTGGVTVADLVETGNYLAGTKVSSMKSSEIKRDLMMMAKENPALFLNLANDENVGLRNVAIKAVEMGIIKLSQDQRSFHWGSNDRKLMTVPFDENPYSAMAAFFKTDEGVEVYRSVDKMIK